MTAGGTRGNKIFDGLSLFKGNHHVMARLTAHYPRDMAMPRGIVGEHDIARPEALDRAVAGLDFDLPSECNDILASRGIVKVT